MSGKENRYYGIYRGTVFENIDPMQMGRIMAIVPDVGGATPSSWAMPCVPFAGKQMGAFVVPQRGAGIWMQYEGGDPDSPVWIGGWWGNAAEVPALALAGVPGDPNIVLQSTLQNAVVISDLTGPAGGVMLRSTLGATIIVNDTGIYIQNGKGANISLVGKQVFINDIALVVT
ncbi:phage baseplate assembly protein V [Burkholderia sp. F1]|uniref:phage baseplate assembly protein V n=1 Tax=Burkholderia sp. F1 TaxID=3366817 RepID=UPI003D72BC64